MYILLQFMKEKTPFNCDTCDSCYKSKLGLKNTFYQFMKIKDLEYEKQFIFDLWSKLKSMWRNLNSAKVDDTVRTS